MRPVFPLALSLALLTPAVASARPFSTQPDDRPWGRGTLMPSLALGGSFYSRGGGSLLVGAGLTYFALNNLGVSLNVRNLTTFLPKSLEQDFPGIRKSIPTNEFSLIPGLLVVLYRSYRASPYVHGGVGPVFLNHQRGTIGQWSAGPGVLIGLGRRLALNLGVSFSSRFPVGKCEAAYRYQDFDVFYKPCGFQWNINVGLVFGLGVGRQRRPDEEVQPSYQPAPAPPPTYPPPQPPPAYAPVEPSEGPPSEAPPSAEPPAYAPPPAAPSAPPPAPASPPPAPATPPPGESVPVTPPG